MCTVPETTLDSLHEPTREDLLAEIRSLQAEVNHLKSARPGWSLYGEITVTAERDPHVSDVARVRLTQANGAGCWLIVDLHQVHSLGEKLIAALDPLARELRAAEEAALNASIDQRVRADSKFPSMVHRAVSGNIVVHRPLAKRNGGA